MVYVHVSTILVIKDEQLLTSILVSRRYDNVSYQSITYQSTWNQHWSLDSVDTKMPWKQRRRQQPQNSRVNIGITLNMIM